MAQNLLELVGYILLTLLVRFRPTTSFKIAADRRCRLSSTFSKQSITYTGIPCLAFPVLEALPSVDFHMLSVKSLVDWR